MSAPPTLIACKRTGIQATQDIECSECGGDVCLVVFARVEPSFGMQLYRAWFLTRDEDGEERQVSREEWVQAERAAGFRPKPGLGPEATGSFSSSAMMLSGRCVDTWLGREPLVARWVTP